MVKRRRKTLKGHQFIAEINDNLAQPNSKRCRTLPPYLYPGCGQPHKIHILNDDDDSIPKFGQVPPEESMHSSDNDSIESDPSEDSLNFRPSTFDPRITTTTAIVPSTIADHQPPPNDPSCTVNNSACLSAIRDLPTFVATHVRSSPPSDHIPYLDLVEYAFSSF